MMKTIFKNLSLLAVLAVLTAGCASKAMEPEHRPKLGVAQNSDGIVTFAITTHPGYTYAIYYEDPKAKVWKLVPDCGSIKGSGEQVEIKKKFNNRGPLPAFTVRHTKIN
ncbi:hypothetical protein P4E94_00825 [Pontiellaceae bacterium B12219]|nr:hypothetical protein [Pontiellaceae bacterium B12219]